MFCRRLQHIVRCAGVLIANKDSEPASGTCNMWSHPTGGVGLDNRSNPGSFERAPYHFRLHFSSEGVRNNKI